MLDTLPLAGYTQLVRNNTRHRIGNKSTLIDHSWTNRVNKHVQTRNVDSTSDHDIILITVLTNGNVSIKEATKRRNYHKFEAENYLTDLMGQKWSQVYDFTDPTLIENKITELLLNVLGKYAPSYSIEVDSYSCSSSCSSSLFFLAISKIRINGWILEFKVSKQPYRPTR